MGSLRSNTSAVSRRKKQLRSNQSFTFAIRDSIYQAMDGVLLEDCSKQSMIPVNTSLERSSVQRPWTR